MYQVYPIVVMAECGPMLLEVLILRKIRFLSIYMKHHDVQMLVGVVGRIIRTTPSDCLLCIILSLLNMNGIC